MNYGGPSHLFGILGALVWGTAMVVLVIIALAVAVMLVRFLWYGTKAAQLYISSHASSVAASTTEPVIPTTIPDAPATAPAAPVVPPPVAPDASGPVPKQRKPKTDK
jgi:heme/copper-type cytochrome/quinol oxidase subunit 2